jgi:hypothetical protein
MAGKATFTDEIRNVPINAVMATIFKLKFVCVSLS